MEQLVEVKSNFSSLKWASIWVVLLLVIILPWLNVLFRFDNVFAIFNIIVDVAVFATIMYLRMGTKIIIDQQERIVDYYLMNLFGKKRQITIDLKHAYFKLDIIKYQGNDLWNLVIIDSENSSKKIRITEITDGYDGQQINYIYQVLNRISSH